LEVTGKARKQPHYIYPADSAHAPSSGLDGLLALAGLTETWVGPDGPVQTCCILTTSPNAVMSPIHDRMPVILGSQDFEAWLAPHNRDAAGLSHLLKPCPDYWLRTRPVSAMVSNARNDRPDLIEPLPSPAVD
jgi:putative SOS response-associated peptidase YedK